LPVSEVDIEKMITHEAKENAPVQNLQNYIFEPNVQTILTDVLPRLVEIQLYEAVLESAASEHSSRMIAMKNAKDSAAKKAKALTLVYNKTRQGAITKEVSEIVSGVESMKDA
jgi:F-type H+-transporting ATPase subunit gamma